MIASSIYHFIIHPLRRYGDNSILATTNKAKSKMIFLVLISGVNIRIILCNTDVPRSLSCKNPHLARVGILLVFVQMFYSTPSLRTQWALARMRIKEAAKWETLLHWGSTLQACRNAFCWRAPNYYNYTLGILFFRISLTGLVYLLYILYTI